MSPSASTMTRTDDVVRFLTWVCGPSDGASIPDQADVFAQAYQRMTLEQIGGIPDFEDPAWMSEFTVAFAERYREALARPNEAAEPWRIAFEEAGKAPGRPLRNLLLGINAHMAYDLTMVLVDQVMDDPGRRSGDYFRLQALLEKAIHPIQTRIASRFGRWMRWLDVICGPLDEHAFLDLFRRTRKRAWQDALAIRAGEYTKELLESRVAAQARRLAAIPC